MPLSEPQARKKLHHRLIDCQGFEREDGLFDIEGRLTDTKTYGFDTIIRGRVEPGDFVHDMKIRMTLDDNFTIVDFEAVSDHHPYKNCGDIAPDYKKLIGLRIIPGFSEASEKAIGGPRGCTHHTSLLKDLANTAYQTLGPVLYRRKRDEGIEIKDMFKKRRPHMLDGCHALARDNENVKQFFPQWYVAKESDETLPESKTPSDS